MSKIYSILKNKKGICTIYTILVMSAILPILLFIVIDIPHFMQYDRKIKNILDNAGGSAITRLQENHISKGVLELNEPEANKVIENIIKSDLFLKSDLTPDKGSVLKEKPTIQVIYVNNHTGSQTVTTPLGDIKVNKTSVVIYGDFPVKGAFFTGFTGHIKKVAVSQVEFK
ncbi:TPA: hypothetical protein N2D99_002040 [Clostridium botulinum]|nr:hypothetical protein [Clostridium botulinum]